MARTPDIRLSVDFFDHPKTQALERELGTTAIVALVRLWCWTARFKPKGYLNGMDSAMIESAAAWKGSPGELHATLVRLHFLDQREDGHHVHDWHIHNGYAFHSEDRSEQARKAAGARWGPRRIAGSITDSITGGSPERNAERNAPYPSPSPYPNNPALPSAMPSASNPCPPLQPRPDPVAGHQPIQRDKTCHVPGCGNRAAYWQGKRGACREHSDTIG